MFSASVQPCTLSSQAAFVSLSYPMIDYMIHLYSNQPISLKCLVSEWHGTPARSCCYLYEVYTRTEMATRTHTKNSCTIVIHKCHKVQLWVQKLENLTSSFHSSYSNLHHLKKKGWGEKESWDRRTDVFLRYTQCDRAVYTALTTLLLELYHYI